MSQVEVGLTPFGKALKRIKKELLENILKEIREEDGYSIKWIKGYGGAWKIKAIK